MTNPREVLESPIEQGSLEKLSYKFDFGNIGVPSTPTFWVLINKTMEDVTTGVTSGSTSTSGNNVITPNVLNLTAGTTYRLVARAVIGTKTYTRYCILKCTADST